MRSWLLTALRALVTAVIAFGLFGFACLFRFNDPNGSYAFLTDDHFFYLVRGWQILFGDLPVRDFVDHGAPLYYYVAAAVQVLFGRGTLSELVFSVTILAACAAGIFLLATRASGSFVFGAAAAFFHILLQAFVHGGEHALILRGRTLQSTLVHQIMQGDDVHVRYVTADDAYHEASFPLSRSASAIRRALGRGVRVRPE